MMKEPRDEGQTLFPEMDEAASVAREQVMGDLLDDSPDVQRLRRGQVVEGTVVRISPDEVLVDIGAKSEAVVPAHEIPSGELREMRIGQNVVAAVLQPEDREGHPVISLNLAQEERHWRDLQQHLEGQEVLQGDVTGFNKGGLIVSVLGVRGFVPLSQLAPTRHVEGSEESLEERLGALRGERIAVKVIEVNRRRNRLILSQRAARQEQRAQERERLLQELRPGEVRHGQVSSVCDFGVFVDLGGADGLIHLSELSWGQVGHPREVLTVGQEVDVYVLSVDREQRRIALSLKRLQREPWDRLVEKYSTGDIVTGRVTRLVPFGAFAEIQDGIEGLIHISELSDQHIAHPRQVVREGDALELKIVRIDAARRRLGLSLRRVSGEPDNESRDFGEAGAVDEGLGSPDVEPEPLPPETTEASSDMDGSSDDTSKSQEAPVHNV